MPPGGQNSHAVDTTPRRVISALQVQVFDAWFVGCRWLRFRRWISLRMLAGLVWVVGRSMPCEGWGTG
jgi:hypothetical protein